MSLRVISLHQSSDTILIFLQVKKSQQEKKRLQAHYLSPSSQNDLLNSCGERVRQVIVAECASADYFSILVDATPDSSHLEQQTFLLRYMIYDYLYLSYCRRNNLFS